MGCEMTALGWVIVAVLVVIAAGALLLVWNSQRRTNRLRSRFGPEYDRTVSDDGSRRVGEAELNERIERREALQIRPLETAKVERYNSEWRVVQNLFVDAPGEALSRADSLLTNVMEDRGYPVKDFEERAAVVSVDHPGIIEEYRRAQGISKANLQGRATTEDLRRAMIDYRSLFERMVNGDGRAHVEEPAR